VRAIAILSNQSCVAGERRDRGVAEVIVSVACPAMSKAVVGIIDGVVTA
jgi:hypothetical protein